MQESTQGTHRTQPDRCIVYTDGSCWEGAGGYGAYIRYPDGSVEEIKGHIRAPTTSQRAEQIAALEALRRITRSIPDETVEITVYSDSMYVVKTMVGAYRRKTNVDLWEELSALCTGRRVRWRWLKGHNHHIENERCHLLAEQGRKEER